MEEFLHCYNSDFINCLFKKKDGFFVYCPYYNNFLVEKYIIIYFNNNNELLLKIVEVEEVLKNYKTKVTIKKLYVPYIINLWEHSINFIKRDDILPEWKNSQKCMFIGIVNNHINNIIKIRLYELKRSIAAFKIQKKFKEFLYIKQQSTKWQ